MDKLAAIPVPRPGKLDLAVLQRALGAASRQADPEQARAEFLGLLVTLTNASAGAPSTQGNTWWTKRDMADEACCCESPVDAIAPSSAVSASGSG